MIVLCFVAEWLIIGFFDRQRVKSGNLCGALVHNGDDDDDDDMLFFGVRHRINKVRQSKAEQSDCVLCIVCCVLFIVLLLSVSGIGRLLERTF